MNAEVKQILSRVGDMYHRYGIKSVTMDDVCRELGISKKTLYAYFSDKNDLVSKIIAFEVQSRDLEFENVFNRNLNAIEELLEVTRLASHLSKRYSATIDYDLKKYYPRQYNELRTVKSERMYNMVLQNMKKGKNEKIFRDDLDEEVIAKLHVSRIIGLVEDSLFSHEEFFSKEVFREIFIYHIRGIANAKGLKILENNLKKSSMTL